MLSGRQYVVLLVGLAVVAAGGLVGLELFAPERSATTEEELPAGAEPLADGTFPGTGEHKVTGTVTLFGDDRGRGLFFEGFSRPGCPATRLYLTATPDPESATAVRAGQRLRPEGDVPQAGNFVVRLGENVTVANATGVAVLCASTDTLFGTAPLQPVNETAERATPTPSPTPANRTATANGTTNGTNATANGTRTATPTATPADGAAGYDAPPAAALRTARTRSSAARTRG